jgi:hypothetical protein
VFHDCGTPRLTRGKRGLRRFFTADALQSGAPTGQHLWPLLDEAVANKHFATLDALDTAISARCRHLDAATIKSHTDFH